MAVGNLNSGVGIQPTLIDAKGDLLVGTADNVVNRLGVTGPTGSVLVTDAGETTGLKWVDPGTVGGLVHIETQTVSAVAAVNFNNVFSATYEQYLVKIRGQQSSSLDFNLRFRASSADNTTNEYFSSQIRLGSNNTFYNANRNPGTSGLVFGSGTNTGNLGGNLYLGNPFTTLEYKSFHSTQADFLNSVNASSVMLSGGILKSATSFDGFTLFTTGTFTGKISVYGYRD
jgi:hypothetical protein